MKDSNLIIPSGNTLLFIKVLQRDFAFGHDLMTVKVVFLISLGCVGGGAVLVVLFDTWRKTRVIDL